MYICYVYIRLCLSRATCIIFAQYIYVYTYTYMYIYIYVYICIYICTTQFESCHQYHFVISNFDDFCPIL